MAVNSILCLGDALRLLLRLQRLRIHRCARVRRERGAPHDLRVVVVPPQLIAVALARRQVRGHQAEACVVYSQPCRDGACTSCRYLFPARAGVQHICRAAMAASMPADQADALCSPNSAAAKLRPGDGGVRQLEPDGSHPLHLCWTAFSWMPHASSLLF